MQDQDRTAAAIVAAARLVADRLRGGGRLLAEGPGRAASDARHIAVEFLHPVIVGKPALPALVGAQSTAGDHDVVVGIGYGGVSLGGRIDVAIADHPVPGASALIELPATAAEAKHAAVVSYHVLWEMVHVFLEQADRSPAANDDLGALYPMLFSAGSGTGTESGSDRGTEVSGGGAAAIEREATASVAAKLREAAAVLDRTRSENEAAVVRAAEIVAASRAVFTFGNGGSATDAEDLAFAIGPRATALSSDNATITALGNDIGFEVVFARPLATLAGVGDSAVGLSTSGTSANVLAGLEHAKSHRLATIGFAGYGGGAMNQLGLDALLVVRSDSVHRIQEAQVGLYCEIVERADSLRSATAP